MRPSYGTSEFTIIDLLLMVRTAIVFHDDEGVAGLFLDLQDHYDVSTTECTCGWCWYGEILVARILSPPDALGPRYCFYERAQSKRISAYSFLRVY